MAASREHVSTKVIKSVNKSSNEKRVIVILERASLESVKVGKQFELLNCDKHKGLAKKFKRDISQCRPDITHQSTDIANKQTCKSGARNSVVVVGSVSIDVDGQSFKQSRIITSLHTHRENVLIEINPQTRIPRTFDRFCGLMVQLLHKLSIHAADGPQKLLKVIKNPITDHLPVGCQKIGTSFQADITDIRDIVPDNEPMVFVVGALAHGSVDVDYIEKTVSISNYPLSAALTCAKLCSAFEEKWGVI